jgi:hypothetical protein
MIFRAMLAVYSDNYTEHINTVCGQNEELFIQITWYMYIFVTVFKGVMKSYWLLLQFSISFTIYFYVSLSNLRVRLTAREMHDDYSGFLFWPKILMFFPRHSEDVTWK